MGCWVSKNWYPGNPYAFAMASAGMRNGSVHIATAGTPPRSSRIPSAKLAALQEPQSPIAATAKLHVARISCICVGSRGVPK